MTLQETITEVLEHAPPEHLELVLAALIEARFIVWPKGEKVRCGRRLNLLLRDYEDTSELWKEMNDLRYVLGTQDCRRFLNIDKQNYAEEDED